MAQTFINNNPSMGNLFSSGKAKKKKLNPDRPSPSRFDIMQYKLSTHSESNDNSKNEIREEASNGSEEEPQEESNNEVEEESNNEVEEESNNEVEEESNNEVEEESNNEVEEESNNEVEEESNNEVEEESNNEVEEESNNEVEEESNNEVEEEPQEEFVIEPDNKMNQWNSFGFTINNNPKTEIISETTNAIKEPEWEEDWNSHEEGSEWEDDWKSEKESMPAEPLINPTIELEPLIKPTIEPSLIKPTPTAPNEPIKNLDSVDNNECAVCFFPMVQQVAFDPCGH